MMNQRAPMRADDAGQAAGATRTGQGTDRGFRQRIASALGGQTEIATERQFKRATEAGSLVSDDDGFFDGFEFVTKRMQAGGAGTVMAPKAARAGLVGRETIRH